MRVGPRTWTVSALLVGVFAILLTRFLVSDTRNDGDIGFIAESAAVFAGLAVVAASPWRAGRRALPLRRAPMPTASLLVLCLATGVALAAPVEMGWTDGCNGLGGVVPIAAAAPVAVGLQDEPVAYAGSSTLVACVPAGSVPPSGGTEPTPRPASR